MASATVATNPAPPPQPPDQVELFIERKLHRTRRQIQRVDVSGGLVTFAIGAVGLLLAAAVADHWLVFGGLGFWGRFLCWTAMLAGGGFYVWRRVLPPLLRRINPVYAAETIERSRPTLKNSLINFLLLRGRRQTVPESVFYALEDRAARDISAAPVEAAVDGAPLIRRGYVLAAALAVFALYLVFSPKSPLTSAARVLWPWARIAAPTRVTIANVEPGDCVRFHGDVLEVSAEVRGARDGEPVLLYFSTADGQLVDQAIPMTPDGEGVRRTAKLPPGSLGLQQDYVYRITAGDCATERFRVEVQPAPVIRVDSVTYRYPAYTEIPDRTEQRNGDLRAIEGTRVTIRATANQEIDRAEMDLDCTGKPGARMVVDGASATGQLVLRMHKEDLGRPEHESYQLRFVDRYQRLNPRPIRHRIEVIPDLPPQVMLVEPAEEEVQLPVDGRLEIRVQAKDPDFALRRVAVAAERGGQRLKLPALLGEASGDKPYAGEFDGRLPFEPAKLGLKPGDRVEYWAIAEDTKQPEANRGESPKRRIVIIGGEAAPQQPPEGQPQPQPGQKGTAQPGGQRPNEGAPGQPAEGGQPPEGQMPPNGPQPEQPGGERKPGEGQGETQPGQPNEAPAANEGGQGNPPNGAAPQPGENQKPQPPREPVDPDANPGDAIEDILKHRDEQQKQGANQNQQPGQQPEQPQPGGQPDQKQPGGQPDQKQPGGQPDQKQPGGRPDQKQPGGQPDQEQPGGQPDQKQPGGQPDQKQPGGQPDQKQPGGQPDQKQPGGQPDQKQPGGQPDQKQPGGQPDQKQPGGQPDQKQPGGQPDQKQPGGQPDQKQPGGQPDQKQPGGQPDQKQPGGQPDQKQPGGQQGNQPPDQQGGNKPQDAGGNEGQPCESGSGQKPPQPDAGNRSEGQMNRTDQQPGAGQKSEGGKSSPENQGDNMSQPKQPDAGGQPDQKDGPQSPSGSSKQSNSQGQTAGDQSGGGQQGGGQQANQPGMGTAGSQADAQNGGNRSESRGPGTAGSKAGEEVQTDRQTGKSAVRRDGDGSPAGKPQPSDRVGKQPSPKDDAGDRPGGQATDREGGRPGQRESERPSGSHSQGNPTNGGRPGEEDRGPPPVPRGEPGGDQANLEFARKQTNLALEHLKDQLDKDRRDLLQRLGWSPDDARRFLAKWEKMQQATADKGPQGKAAQKQLDDALRALGLRWRGTELRGGGTSRDKLGGLRENARFKPPAEWAEQVGDYHRTVAGEK